MSGRSLPLSGSASGANPLRTGGIHGQLVGINSGRHSHLSPAPSRKHSPAETLHGEITDETFQVDFLIELSGATPLHFTVTPDTVSGDLIPLMGITPADEVEFEVAEAENGIASMVYPAPDAERFTAGYYIIAVTREDVDEGDTQGQFELVIAPLPPD
jgi:hypothetical protein